jgi:tRNA pseudouridine55 synthase
MTSRRVVDRVQQVTRCRKVGHAGTLDPLASGVLVVCVGQATRLVKYIQQTPKQYTATFLLGRHSSTEDVEGDVTELPRPPIPSLDQLNEAARRLTGEILQRPPAYSALKIAGRRAYDLARRGQPVQLQPRTITVYRLDVVGYDYPEVRLDIACGSGTYIRALGRDLAESLGTAAVMSTLVRTAIGPFRLSDAIAPDWLSPANWSDRLLPPYRAVEHLPCIEVSDEQVVRIRTGLTITYAPTSRDQEIAAIGAGGQLVALLEVRGPNCLGPTRVFLAEP